MIFGRSVLAAFRLGRQVGRAETSRLTIAGLDKAYEAGWNAHAASMGAADSPHVQIQRELARRGLQ